jgi:DNA repair protein RecN (Recombination protein N)
MATNQKTWWKNYYGATKIILIKKSTINQFFFNELEEINLKENELEDLDTELQLLNNSEAIKNILQKVYYE